MVMCSPRGTQTGHLGSFRTWAIPLMLKVLRVQKDLTVDLDDGSLHLPVFLCYLPG